MANGWTAERKERQARLIQTWGPWTKSTGPKTIEGKAKSSQNAYKHGGQSRDTANLLQEIRKLLRKQKNFMF